MKKIALTILTVTFLFLCFTKASSQIYKPQELKVENVKSKYELIFCIGILDLRTNIGEHTQQYNTPKKLLNLNGNDENECLKILKTLSKDEIDNLRLWFEKFREIDRLSMTIDWHIQKEAFSWTDWPVLDIDRIFNRQCKMYVLHHYALIKAFNTYTNTKIIDPERFNGQLFALNDISLENIKKDNNTPPPPPPAHKKKN